MSTPITSLLPQVAKMPPQPYNPAQQGDDTSGIVFDYEPKDSSGSVEVDHESQTIDKRDSSEDLSDPNIAFDERYYQIHTLYDWHQPTLIDLVLTISLSGRHRDGLGPLPS